LRDRLPTKQTWSLEALYLLQIRCAFLAVARWSQLIICFSLVVLLVLFGHWCVCGLASQWWSTILYVITSFSLLIRQVVLEHVALFCSSFGLPASGPCGRREIIGFFEAQRVLLLRCWTRSSSFPLGCWRRRVSL
jgi:hypothetical protein